MDLWQVEILILMRSMLFDLDTPYKYSDCNLQKLYLSAAQLLQTEINFTVNYAVDMTNESITPDPTQSPRDNAFINLSVLKSLCILDQIEANRSAGKSIAIRDGSSSIDLRGNAATRIEILKLGWCRNYENVRYEFMAGNVSAGEAVVGPFREYADYWVAYAGNPFVSDLLMDGRYR